MVDILPFRGLRYNLQKTPRLHEVICPPYDVIGVPEYHRLLGRHPFNLVRVELPLAQGREDRYAVAARFWRRWQARRILLQDKTPAFYGYEQRFCVNGQQRYRRGFFAALRLEKPGHGRIRPHERTFPKHKEDRLRLMRATHANISPIFGIFFDARGTAGEVLVREMAKKPLAVTRDDKSVTHRFWVWTDPAVLSTLRRALKQEEVLIADGHHRYETAWNYAKERRAGRRGKKRTLAPEDFVLIFLCPLGDPGLVIQPTHRAVRASLPLEEWERRLAPHYQIRPLSGVPALLARLRQEPQALALGMALEGGKLFWLKPKPGTLAARQLPVVTLHERVLKGIPLDQIAFDQDPRGSIESIQRGEAHAAFLLPPPDKEMFARICRAGRLLPQKSTFFYPKVATGLVMRNLENDLPCTHP